MSHQSDFSQEIATRIEEAITEDPRLPEASMNLRSHCEKTQRVVHLDFISILESNASRVKKTCKTKLGTITIWFQWQVKASGTSWFSQNAYCINEQSI